MQVKIDTRERFHVITVLESTLPANMTGLIENKLSMMLSEDVKNVILNLENVDVIDNAAAQTLIKLQQRFYGQKASFVVCSLSANVNQQLAEAGLLEQMNSTPTQSEAGEIVMMEEIERELGEYEL